MAERVMVVCDVCATSPADTVAIAAKGKSYRKDLCAADLAELLSNTRAPQRGRPRTARPAAAPVAAAPKRRGRPPKQAAAEPAASAAPVEKKPRRKITDPAVLAKRRAALEKARKVRAENRAAAKRSG